MKILFIGDYSNLHACLADELRRLGHYVTVVSDRGGFQQTKSDIMIRRNAGLFGSVRYLYDVMTALSHFRGYDVVQIINPHFFNLKPGKLAYVFRELKRNNGKAFLTLCGNDHYFVDACVNKDIFRFSEFRVGSEPTPFATSFPEREKGYLRDDVRRYTEIIYSEIAAAMAVLPEYDMAARPILGDRCHFTNIPIDLTTHSFTESDWSGPLKVMVGMKPGMEMQKGTGLLYEAAMEAAARCSGEVQVQKVSGLAYRDYLDCIRRSNVVLDQLYAYAPATNALDTMALGRVAASGAQKEYFDFISEKSSRPLIPLSPMIDDLTTYLSVYLDDRKALMEMAQNGRKLVEAENDVRIVAKRFSDVWEKYP